MTSSWAAETINSINRVHQEDTAQLSFTDAVAGSELNIQEESIQSRSKQDQAVEAAARGDLTLLRSFFTNAQGDDDTSLPSFNDDQPLNEDGERLLSQVLEAAVRNKHVEIITYIFTTFPTISVSRSVVSSAVDHQDPSIFSLLLAQDPTILNRELGDYLGPPLSFAVWGADPTFANLLLDHGADPNLGGFGHLSNLYLAVQKQPVEVIRKMVERGADANDPAVMRHAKESGRDDVVKYLEDTKAKQNDD